MRSLYRLIQNETVSGERGQATLEYILLSVVLVSVMTGAFYQFHSGFRDYANVFFGGYIRCLIEAGELPVAGLDEESICGSIRESLASGEGGQAGGGSGANGEGESEGGEGGEDASSAARRSSGNAESASGGGNRVTVRVGSGSRNNSEGRGGRPRSSSSSSENEEGTYTGSSEALSFVRTDRQSSAEDRSRPERIPVEGISGQIQGDSARKSDAKIATLKSEEGEGGRKAVLKYTPPERVPAQLDNQQPALSIGKLLQWFIIIALIIAILILVGGQALQIAKGWEK